MGICDRCYCDFGGCTCRQDDRIESLKRAIRDIMSVAGCPDKDLALRTIIKIGREALEVIEK